MMADPCKRKHKGSGLPAPFLGLTSMTSILCIFQEINRDCHNICMKKNIFLIVIKITLDNEDII